jgi:hypothetical protein
MLALGVTASTEINIWKHGSTCTGELIGDQFDHIKSYKDWSIDECEKACVAESKRFVIAAELCCDYHEVTIKDSPDA